MKRSQGAAALPPEVKQWLATPVQSMFTGETTVAHTRTPNRLRQHGIALRRDILVAGRCKVEDIYELGRKSLQLLDRALVNEFGITWQAEPSAADAAAICTDLSEVNAIAVARRGIQLKGLYTVRSSEDPVFASIQYVLDHRTHERVRYNVWGGFASPHDAINGIYGAAVQFAEDFQTAQHEFSASPQ